MIKKGLKSPIPHFVVRRGRRDGLWGGLAEGKRYHFSPGYTTSRLYLPPTREDVNVFARVCLSVCLSVSKITQKRVHGFG